MKHVATIEFVSAVELSPPKMTRKEKIMRLAYLVKMWRGTGIALHHRLEYCTQQELDSIPVRGIDCHVGCCVSPFSLAAQDHEFQRDSGGTIGPESSLGDTLRYLEISQGQAHEFSCDCGGAISPYEMADRIERLA